MIFFIQMFKFLVGHFFLTAPKLHTKKEILKLRKKSIMGV